MTTIIFMVFLILIISGLEIKLVKSKNVNKTLEYKNSIKDVILSNGVNVAVTASDDIEKTADFEKALTLSLEKTMAFMKGRTLEQINYKTVNNGFCAVFADYVKDSFIGDIDVFYDNDYKDLNHAFIRYKNKYYDSECFCGVDDYKDLPIYL